MGSGDDETDKNQGKEGLEEDTSTEDQIPLSERAIPPPMYDAPFDHMDIVEAIDQLAECSGPGPDGISAILWKKSKLTVALMLFNIFNTL